MKFVNLLLFVGLLFCADNSAAQSIYVTTTGDKYHKSTCHYLKNSKNEIAFEKVVELSYTACSVCKPTAKGNALGFKSTSTKYTNAPTVQNATSAQCTGKTKSGARCKRMTKSGNGRCYQH